MLCFVVFLFCFCEISLEKNETLIENVARTTGAVSHSLSVHDLPGHTKMKFRQQGQAAPGELEKRDLRKELEERERKHLQTSNKSGFAAEESGRKRKHQKLLKNSAEEEKSSDDVQENKRTKRELDDYDDSDDTASSSSDSEDDSDSDDEEALLLELELQKIKKERAEQKRKQAEEEAKRKAEEDLEGVVRGNPLLVPSGGGLSRRWDDDVVFKNQARDEPKLKKRFVNDTIRNDFHRRFMKKYIK